MEPSPPCREVLTTRLCNQLNTRSLILNAVRIQVFENKVSSFFFLVNYVEERQWRPMYTNLQQWKNSAAFYARGRQLGWRLSKAFLIWPIRMTSISRKSRCMVNCIWEAEMEFDRWYICRIKSGSEPGR